MEQFEKLLQSIDIINRLDLVDYVMLAGPEGHAHPRVDAMRKKAALVAFDSGGGSVITDWLPFSQLRYDRDKNLYLIEWVFRRAMANNV